MRTTMTWRAAVQALAVVILLPCGVPAQTISHPDPYLNHIYPAGVLRGQTVTVELGAINGLTGASKLVIDGPPGITVREFKSVNHAEARATLEVAADAAPGRRLLRVAGGSAGLTNGRPFFIGVLPEAPQEVTLPVVVNGRVHPNLDVDCYSFTAKAGQKLVLAVLAHGMDSMLRGGRQSGYLDTALELLDEKGRVLATADDSLGLDPVLEHTVKADGRYTVRVTSLGYAGSVSAVYRLTLGEVPYPTHVFPAGGKRGTTVEVEFGGPNVPPGTRRRVEVPAVGEPVLYLAPDLPGVAPVFVQFLPGDQDERSETEPNDGREKASDLTLATTVNGRFDRPGDADWFRVTLKKGEGLLLEVAAQRYVGSPADTLLEVFDASGKKLAENDDAPMYAGQCEHDFPSADSRLEFTAPADGTYFVRLAEQGGAGGPRHVYRLEASRLRSDFRLFQWPDAVPVWGPGTTASFVVQVQRWGGLQGDIRLAVEGLPKGWAGSVSNLPNAAYVPPNGPTNQKALLTITAPAGAAPGELAAFRVVGVAEHGGRRIERVAQPLTLYGSSFNDRMHFRVNPVARAVVAPHLDSWLETSVKELSVESGGKVQVPVKVHRRDREKKAALAVTIDGETPAAGCGWRVPLTLRPDQDEVMLELDVGTERRPGTYGIVASRSWASDLRAGRPGPCTPVILLTIRPKGK